MLPFPRPSQLQKSFVHLKKSMQNGHIEIELPAAMAVGTKESM
jgi:hypothetical protein